MTACLSLLTIIAVLIVTQSAASAATMPPLGTASTFAVLAGTTVTNTGSSVVNGDLGVSPGTAVTGFPPGTVNGTQHAGDAAAATAQTDLTTAYNNAAGQSPTTSGLSAIGGGPACTTLRPRWV